MRIGFDGKRFFHNNTGLGNYSRSLIKVLSEYLPENKCMLIKKISSSSSDSQQPLEPLLYQSLNTFFLLLNVELRFGRDT